MTTLIELAAVYWEYCRNPGDVPIKRAEAVSGVINALKEHPKSEALPLLVEGILKTSFQAAAALQRRGTTDFLLDLFKTLEKPFFIHLINANPPAFIDLVQIVAYQASDWHCVATSLLPLITLLLDTYSDELNNHRAPPPKYLLDPDAESLSYRTRPVGKSPQEAEMLDFSQAQTNKATAAPEQDKTTESFLVLDTPAATVPLSVILISAPLIYVFGPNFAEAIRTSIYDFLQTAIDKHTEGECADNNTAHACAFVVCDSVMWYHRMLPDSLSPSPHASC